MIGQGLSVLILFLGATAVSSTLPSHNHNVRSKKLDLHHFLRENLYSQGANLDGWEDTVLTEHQRKVLLLVFRGIDVDRTPLDDILHGKSIAQQTPVFDLAGILERLEADEQIRHVLKEQIAQYETRHPYWDEELEDEDEDKTEGEGKEGDYLEFYSQEEEEEQDADAKNHPENQPNDDVPESEGQQQNPGTSSSSDREEYGDQVGGYEGCRRDYATYIEPLTDTFLYNMHTELCEEHPEECDNETMPNEPYRNMTSWARTMIDAMGKLPAALADGQLHWAGSFEMCKELEIEYDYYNHTYMEPGIFLEKREFHGEYCRVDLKRFDATNRFRLALGICVPDTCSRQDVQRYIWEDNVVLRRILEEGLGVNVTYIWCGHILDGSTDPGFQTAVAILIIILILGVAATVYDVAFRRRVFKQYAEYLRPSLSMYAGSPSPPSSPTAKESLDGQPKINTSPEPSLTSASDPGQAYRKFSSASTISSDSDSWKDSRPRLSMQLSTDSQGPLFGRSLSMYDLEFEPATWLDRLEVAFVGFSFYSNLARIFSTKTKKDHLECMNGIRFLSFCWLILGHTFIFGPVYADCWISMNLVRAAVNLSREFTFQHIIGFTFHSDTFFVISGTLTTYWFLKHYAARGSKLSRGFIAYYFLHRWWRLMPTYMFGMMFLCTLYQYLGPHGVFVPEIVDDLNNCHETWWRNFLFINNFFRDTQCMTWSMYMAILMQLHIVSILVVVPLVKKPIIAYAVLFGLLVIQIGATAGVASSIYDDRGWLLNLGDWYFDIWQMPWCRAGPYIVGLTLGIILYKTNCTFQMSWWMSLSGWLLALFTLFTVIYSQYDQYKEGGEVWSASALVAYDTLARTAWGVGIAWIIFACSTGHGNIITMFLSLKIYQPLCRLIYPAFMLHAMMLFAYMYGQMTPYYIDERNLNYVFFANLEIVYLAGIFIALWFHYPITIGLERALLCKTKLQAIMSGCHPNDDVMRYVDDRYLGHTQPWSLGGAKSTGNRPPKDLGYGLGTSPSSTNLTAISEETRDQANGEIKDQGDERTQEGDLEHEEVQPDGTVFKRQISTTSF